MPFICHYRKKAELNNLILPYFSVGSFQLPDLNGLEENLYCKE